MSSEGQAVLDLARVQHIAAAEPHRTLCGVEWVTLDLHWATTTRVHCGACLITRKSPPPRSTTEHLT